MSIWIGKLERRRIKKRDVGGEHDASSGPDRPFVVGVGTSAGGLGALERLLALAPPDPRLAFVIVQHLDASQESHLPEILGRRTELPVAEARDGTRVQAGHIYTMPAGKALTIEGGVLRLHARQPGLRFPIDTFLRSLAEDQEEKAVGLILTGSGHDGTSGVKALHEHGGLVVVQDPGEAEFPDMPQNALDTGVVDLRLGVEEIAQRLVRHTKGEPPSIPSQGMDAVMDLLNSRGPPDFSHYGEGTVTRRLQRRITLRGVPDLDAYVEVLRGDVAEVERLRKDLLLGVTSFFRDPRAFLELETQVVPGLFRNKDEPVRVWVAGCATGEEAYSVAMLIHEARQHLHRSTHTQVFATDISEDAIATARKGVYTEDELADVPDERRRRFFEPAGAHMFRVKREFREMIAFAVHDLLSNPPLPAMDLVCCRNLLIYLKPEAQERVLQALQFSLRPGGHLMLGRSETTDRVGQAFSVVSKNAAIYRRDETARTIPRQFGTSAAAKPKPAATQGKAKGRTQPAQAARDWLLERHAPAAVAVDAQRKVVFVHGPVEPYLRLPRGAPSMDVLALARGELRPRLRAALHQSEQKGERVRLSCATPEGAVEICVDPVVDTELALVTFRPQESAVSTPAPDVGSDTLVQDLEDELQATKQQLDETVASSQAAEEELRATGEEVTSMNEELRTTIEELEARKEEMSALNDELQDLNARLTSESRMAGALADDLSNLFASTGIPVLFLDRDLRVRRRTPATDRFFGSDDGVGRSIEEIPWLFADEDLVRDAHHVLQHLTPVTRDVRSQDGRRHRRRILPYRSSADRIGGVVVVFEDVESLMRIEDRIRAAEAYAAAVVRAVPTPFVVLKSDLRIEAANPAFHATFGALPGDVTDRSLGALLGTHWDLDVLRRMLEEPDLDSDDRDIRHEQDGRAMVFRLHARRIASLDGVPRVLLAMQDITALKDVERDLMSFTAKLHRRVERQASAAVEKSRLLERVSYAIGHDLKEPVRAMDTVLTFLSKDHEAELSSGGRDLLDEARAENRRLGNLVRGLLAFTRAMAEDVDRVYPVSVRAALDSEDCTTRYAGLLDERGGRLEVHGEDRLVEANMPSMGYILGNIIQNAILHNPLKEPQVHVYISDGDGNDIDVAVQDNGPGLPRDVVTGFDKKSVATRGFGLTIAKEMTRFLGGAMRLESPPGTGSTVHIRLPAADPATQEMPAAT